MIGREGGGFPIIEPQSGPETLEWGERINIRVGRRRKID